MSFPPVAIVGQGCVLPGALSPGALWEAVAAGRDLTTPPPPGAWPVDPRKIIGRDGESFRNGTRPVPCSGGFVTGFDEIFEPDGFRISEGDVAALDRSVQWLLEATRQAVQDAGYGDFGGARAAVVIGNNAYPTATLVEMANRALVEEPLGLSTLPPRDTADGRRYWANRFSAGRPAHLIASAFAAEGPAFCLDAACASSLYAIKLACDYLHDGTADVALTGGLSGTDNIFLHLGFSEISALSPSGRNRPFSRRADGLLPAEGAAVLVLKRLSDAVRDGDHVHAAIRGVGLSNDGRRGGLLSPDVDGQVAALRRAYDVAAVDPATISLLECHATGTPTGDQVELDSARYVFDGAADLPVGSLKSNIGHLLTAAGTGGIIKIIGAMAHGVRPPTLHAEEPLAAFDEAPLRPLQAAELWPDKQIRRAGISNFGFGGNNAHLILEQFSEPSPIYPVKAPPTDDEPIVICGVGLIAGEAVGLDGFARGIFSEGPQQVPFGVTKIAMPFDGMKFPPKDLQQSLGQQTAVLEACRMSLGDIANVDPDRCGVFIGMGCDVDAARPGLRYRLGVLLERAGISLGEKAQSDLLAAVGGLAGADYVMGAMPNLPANRVGVQHDFRGPSYTVAAEELSGFAALEIAARAVRTGEIDMAIAGAVDLSDEPVHRLAVEAILPNATRPPADAAIVFVLKRRSDAEAAGDRILGAIDIDPASQREEDEPALQPNADGRGFGHTHAAAAMVDTAIALTTISAGVDARSLRPRPGAPRTHRTTMASFTGRTQSATLRDVAPAVGFGIRPDAAHLFFAAADSVVELRSALEQRVTSLSGPIRIAIAAANQLQLKRKISAAIGMIDKGERTPLPGIHFGKNADPGEVALLYPGTGAAYPGMMEALALAYPQITADLSARPGMAGVAAFYADTPQANPHLNEAAAMAFAAVLGTRVVRDCLGVAPSAALGLSMGEVSMLVANDVWGDPKAILDGLDATGFYEKLAGDHPMMAEYLGLSAPTAAAWENHEIIAPVEQVEAAVRGVPNVWMTIVTSPDHCAIGGTPEGCRAVAAHFPQASVIRSGNGLAFHGPFAEGVADSYRRIHTQPVTRAESMRFYFNATHGVVEQDSRVIADCLRTQLLNTVDFRPTVENAWADGVRTFIEIGPRSTLTAAVKATLRGCRHLVVSLDGQRRDGLRQLAETAAALFVAGLPVDLTDLSARLSRLRGEPPDAPSDEKRLSLPAHLPPIPRKTFEKLRKGKPVMEPGHEDPPSHVMSRPPHLPPPGYRVPDLQTGISNSAVAINSPPEEGPPSGHNGNANRVHRTEVSVPKVSDTTTEQDARREQPEPARVNARTARASAFDASPAPVRPIDVLTPEGPSFDRDQLEVLAGGRISDVFGGLFAQQDGFVRQCRMPQPPLLLADRVLGIKGDPGTMGKGVCWTETDIHDDAWYLNNGSMPTGLMIEAGQADLLLISWLGVDFLNRDERVYRLLGCEITFHDGPLPQAGDTIRFQIHVDGHATLGDTRMFFFRYDAHIGERLVSSVRSGQAGFFSESELANSGGVLWSPETDTPRKDARCDPAPAPSAKRSFSQDDVRAFAEGDAFACFGPGFELAAAHQRTPAIPRGRMQLIDRISAFDPDGGPWGRGYLKAECDVPIDAWFYDGHFKNDPCMPGTLMADAASQALQFHLAALGFTIDRDGWQFRPVTGEAFKFVCRGQVVPDKPHLISYEVFVEEIVDGDEPTVYAALLAKSDDHKVFLCRRFGVKLVRDWPLFSKPEFLADHSDRFIVSPSGDVPGDHKALLACAWGKPSDAFGQMYRRFDRESRIPRLPGPPYHCISRIVSIDCGPGKPTPGGKVVTEFDVDPEAWYFADGGNGAMPFSILTEVLLQPCGWLASYMGFALAGDLKLRNLDGTDVCIEREIGRNAGTLTVEATFTRSAVAGPTSIVFYDITCHSSEGRIVQLKTDFGLFPAEALASQKGLPVTDAHRRALSLPSALDPGSVVSDPLANDLCAGSPAGRLAMLDSVTGFWPEGGKAGLGRVTGTQTIDPSSWYFKAHFFDDPVQPGSLGLEALFSLFKAAVKLKGLHENYATPRFEAPAIGATLGWKYRGQVIPTNSEVITEIDLVEIVDEGDSVLVTAEGSLWVDGLRIYEVSGYALRVREGRDVSGRQVSEKGARAASVKLDDWVIDAEASPWLRDHCPTFSIPVYPMMALAGDLLVADGRGEVIALADIELGSWLRLDRGPVRLSSKTFAMPDGRINRQLFQHVAGRDKRIGRAVEIEADAFPVPPPRWSNHAVDGEPVDPYRSGELFHRGAFEVARDVQRSQSTSRFWFDAGDAWSRANGHPSIFLDAMVHGIPHWQPSLWFGVAAEGFAAFPYRVESLQLFAPLPRTGRVDVLTRAVDMPTPRTIRLEVQATCGGAVVLELALVEVLVPLGVYQRLAPEKRQSFACDRQYAEGWAVADVDGPQTTLSLETVRLVNWLPGTLEAVYGLPFDGSSDETKLTEQLAIKDHFAVRHRLHPSDVRIEDDKVFPGGEAPTAIVDLNVRWDDNGTFCITGGVDTSRDGRSERLEAIGG